MTPCEKVQIAANELAEAESNLGRAKIGKKSGPRKIRNAKRKEWRRLKRECSKYNRREHVEDKQEQKQDSRTERIQVRQDSKTERVTVRQTERTQRNGEKQETKRTAYENGIDPNSWIGDTGKAVSSTIGSIFGGMASNKLAGQGITSFSPGYGVSSNSPEQKSNKNIIYILLAVLAFFMLNQTNKTKN